MAIRHLRALGTVLVWAVACGGNSEEHSSAPMLPTGRIELEDAAEPWAAAICAYSARCRGAFDRNTIDDCEKNEIAWFQRAVLPSYADSIARGAMFYDPDSMSKCLEDFYTSPCTQNDTFPDCKVAIGGTIALGDPCGYDAECDYGAWCNRRATCAGVCTAALAVGEECENTVECQPGLYCTEGFPRSCQPYVQEGGECGPGTFGQCALDLICSSNDVSVGVCKSWHTVAVGAACDALSGIYCEAGAACVAVDELASGEWDQRCMAITGSAGECFINPSRQAVRHDNCPTGEYCPVSMNDLNSIKLSSQCVALDPSAPIGADCKTAACESNAFCSSTTYTCEPLGKPGDPCIDRYECLTGVCIDGTCGFFADCE